MNRRDFLRKGGLGLTAVAFSLSLGTGCRLDRARGESHVVPPPTGGDDARMIRRFLAGMPDGTLGAPTVIVFPPAALYRLMSVEEVEGQKANVHLLLRRHVILDGQGATFDATLRADGGGPIWDSRGCVDVVMRDMTTVGVPAGSDEHQHVYAVKGGDGFLCDRVEALENLGGGDGFYVGRYRDQAARNVTVQNFTVDGATRNGVSVTHADGFTLRQGALRNVRNFHPIDLEPLGPTDAVRNVRIENVSFGPYQQAGGRYCVNASAGGADDVSIQGSTTEAGTFFTVSCVVAAERGPNSNWRILGNRQDPATLSTVRAMTFRNTHGVEVADNFVRFESHGDLSAIRILDPGGGSGCSGHFIHGNRFPGAGRVWSSDGPACLPRLVGNSPAG